VWENAKDEMSGDEPKMYGHLTSIWCNFTYHTLKVCRRVYLVRQGIPRGLLDEYVLMCRFVTRMSWTPGADRFYRVYTIEMLLTSVGIRNQNGAVSCYAIKEEHESANPTWFHMGLGSTLLHAAPIHLTTTKDTLINHRGLAHACWNDPCLCWRGK